MSETNQTFLMGMMAQSLLTMAAKSVLADLKPSELRVIEAMIGITL